MKILVIEDNQKHLVDAKAVVAEMRIEADFATTYVDAKNMMENNKYDGIVSDIFFPYAEKTSYPLKGWSFAARFECENMLNEIIHRICRSDIKWIKAANKWISGQEMHPTGIMIARDCLNAAGGLPVTTGFTTCAPGRLQSALVAARGLLSQAMVVLGK